MDEVVEKYAYRKFDDNMLVSELGILWQINREPMYYGSDYWYKYIDYEHAPIAIRLNKLRCDLVEKYCSAIIDVGIGCGEFIKKIRIPALGYDVNPVAIQWLKERNLYCDLYKEFPAVNGLTLWDVLEHVPNPKALLDVVPVGCLVFLSMPIVDFDKIYESRHYRPAEHLTYFSSSGLVNYFNLLGFGLLINNNAETLAGREDIETFVFRKACSTSVEHHLIL